MVPPRAPGPGQRLRPRGRVWGDLPSGRQVGAPQAGWGAAPGAGRGARGGALPPCLPAALPAAAPAARRGPDCQRRPRAGMRRRRRRRRRRAAGGAGRGRAEDGVTWAGPAARDPPPPTPGGGPERRRPWTPWPAGLASPGASPAGCPRVLGAGARSRHAWLRVAWLGRARERRPGCPVPGRARGTGGHSSPSPPLRALQRRPPPHPSAGAWEPDPGPTAADPPERGCRPRAPKPLALWAPGPSTQAAHPGAFRELDGASPCLGQLGTVAGDCRNLKPRFWLATRSGRALSGRVLT
ncbi:basic proline-rich protein-like [Cervus canadensis]|uniref:basic proline-rich protein-like n=1 Tax=Cervus canadensis TaxID=1574408 RepID=UPI001CA366D0|nr:basic proline-rich protein-like [Cervus canadensis]